MHSFGFNIQCFHCSSYILRVYAVRAWGVAYACVASGLASCGPAAIGYTTIARCASMSYLPFQRAAYANTYHWQHAGGAAARLLG